MIFLYNFRCRTRIAGGLMIRDYVVNQSKDNNEQKSERKILRSLFILLFIFYNYLTVYVVPRPIPCFLKKPDFTNLLTICNTFVFPNPVYSTNFLEGKALNCRISYIFFSSAVNLSKFCSMTGKMIFIEFYEIYYIIKRAQKRT